MREFGAALRSIWDGVGVDVELGWIWGRSGVERWGHARSVRGRAGLIRARSGARAEMGLDLGGFGADTGLMRG